MASEAGVAADVSGIIARLEALQEEMTGLRRQLISHRDSLGLGAADEVSVLVCRARGHSFGVPVSFVDSVVPVAECLPLPGTPPWILGSLNYHGRNIAVVDVGQRLANVSHVVTPSELIVVCATDWQPVGLLTDEVVDVANVDANEVKEPAPGERFASFLLGVVQLPSGPLPLIEVSTLAALESDSKGEQ